MTPDKVCERLSVTPVALSIKMIDADVSLQNGDVPLLVVEGSEQALKFLAKILIAVAESKKSDTFCISPAGSGNSHFDKASTHGIYVRRI
jgi:hypothetical protein